MNRKKNENRHDGRTLFFPLYFSISSGTRISLDNSWQRGGKLSSDQHSRINLRRYWNKSELKTFIFFQPFQVESMLLSSPRPNERKEGKISRPWISLTDTIFKCLYFLDYILFYWFLFNFIDKLGLYFYFRPRPDFLSTTPKVDFEDSNWERSRSSIQENPDILFDFPGQISFIHLKYDIWTWISTESNI